jgi:inner membrane protein
VTVSPVTHFLSGWVLANALPLGRRDRALVTWSAVLPDVDGLGIVAEIATRNSSHPLLWFSRYHHSLHNLAFAVVVAGLAFALAEKRGITAAACLLGFHLHLLEDLIGSRGPDGDQWPIPYLAPFSNALQWSWHGQWNLNAWPNIVITLVLVAVTLYLAWRRGYSPMEIFSPKIDREVVMALRRRFPQTDETAR